VICHHYASIDEFSVHIPDAEGKDLLFLIKSPKQLAVDDVIDSVIKLEKKGGSTLASID
jgi:hypothetical protein